MENDMDLRDRLNFLEKRLDDQNDEIICLRSTLADALRRLVAVESLRGSSPTKESARSAQSASGLVDCNTPSSCQPSRDMSRRQVSSSNTTSVQNRNSNMKESNGSLVSESPSSSSASPAPSPSPTSRQQHVQFNSFISEVGNSRNKASFLSIKPSFMSSMSTTSNLQTAKRWSSTSDFVPSNALI
jgi:microtubule-associated protein-like 1/2